MINIQVITLLNLTVSAMLTGLIWTIQVVHYPGFLKVGAEQFTTYQHSHMRTISYIVIPLMLVELIAALLLQFLYHHSIPRITYLATAMVLVVWVSTLLVSSPLHGKLAARGFDPQVIQQLIDTNWIRTIAWSLRTGVLFYVLLEMRY